MDGHETCWHGSSDFSMDLKEFVRLVPDFPLEGILYRDITPMLSEPRAYQYVIDSIYEEYRNHNIDVVLGVEARGFIFAGPVAYKLKASLVPARKQGKLPFHTNKASYSLEYNKDTLELHKDAIAMGENVLIVDDLLATGGTIEAAVNLVEQSNAKVEGIAVVIEIASLNGRKKLSGYKLASLLLS